jgi:hypothetical protein
MVMPNGTCTVRIQNNTGALITSVNFNASNGHWNQNPPATVAAGATSANFQMSYNFAAPADSQFDMQYSLPGQQTHFTAAAIIDQPQGGPVTCSPSGAGPAHHQVTFNVVGAAPAFTVLFTFN